MASNLESEMVYTLPEFVEFMNPAKLATPTREGLYGEYKWVFWSEEENDDDLVQGLESVESSRVVSARIKEVLVQETEKGMWPWALVQFWKVKLRDGELYLTTSDQPFSLLDLGKRECSIRKHCMKQTIHIPAAIADDDVHAQNKLGPIGRAFRNLVPESTPDVGFYSLQEYPHRDLAVDCGLTELLILPVFEFDGNEHLVGILECLDYPLPC